MSPICGVFGLCSLINVGLLLFSFVVLASARTVVYNLHSRLFPMSEEQFNRIMYTFLGGYKILIIVFNIVPFLALCIVENSRF